MKNTTKLAAFIVGSTFCFAGIEAQGGTSVSTVVSFNGTNGSNVRALIQGKDGNLYGTTWAGGTENPNGGTVFRLAPDGTLTSLVSFDGTNYIMGEALVEATEGNFYGSTFFGGPGAWQGDGMLFRMTPAGALSEFHVFDGTNGSGPQTLIQGRDGNLYGTTLYGGSNYMGLGSLSGNGTVFRIDTNGTFTPLAYFQGTNGAIPFRILQGQDGSFYGVTVSGGVGFTPGFGSPNGQGTVFKMTPDGTITTLAFFDSTNTEYTSPIGITQGRDGNLYGVTSSGGEYNAGTVFRVTLNGVLTTLHSFDGTNGAGPFNLVEAPDGSFYGATENGGTIGNSFATVFRITSAGLFTKVANITSSNGVRPQISFIQGADGNFYGGASEGGAYNKGTAFRVSVPLPPVFQSPTQDNGAANLQWSSVAGQSYQLEYTADLASTYWNNLGSPIVATNGVMSADDLIGSNPQRFYRVGVLP